MKPFPGKLQKATRAHAYVLTDEQREWFMKTYPVTENRLIISAMGISYPTLHKMKRMLGVRKSARGLKEIYRRKHEEHKHTNRHYRLLLLSGQKITRCTNLRLQPYTKRQIDLRRSALVRGYLLDADIREGSPGRYAIYYDDETTRSAKFEATCKRHGLRVERD